VHKNQRVLLLEGCLFFFFNLVFIKLTDKFFFKMYWFWRGWS